MRIDCLKEYFVICIGSANGSTSRYRFALRAAHKRHFRATVHKLFIFSSPPGSLFLT